MHGSHRKLTPSKFIDNQRGAMAVTFVLSAGFLMGMLALALDGARFITERARLSDALEQAALALTSENNPEQSVRNKDLVNNYIKAYMRHAKRIDDVKIKKIENIKDKSTGLIYNEYHVSSTLSEKSWFTGLYPNFGELVNVGDNGVARNYRSHMDVMFVADFSGSMGWEYDGGGTRIEALKSIISELTDQIFQDDISNKIGFVPFDHGTHADDGPYCSYQYYKYPNAVISDDIMTVDLKVDEDKWAGYRRLMNTVDIRRTVDMFPRESRDYRIPIDKTDSGNGQCLSKLTKGSNPPYVGRYNLPLTSNRDEVHNHLTNLPLSQGATLVSSGVIAGAQKLATGDATKKILIIVSDGTDHPVGTPIPVRDVSKELVEHGLCEKIRSVLSQGRSEAKLAFIAINYFPTTDWSSCVGKNNMYSPQNFDQLQEALHNAVFEEVGHNAIKD